MYSIVYSNRKTVGIHIHPIKGVTIRAPKRISQKQLKNIIDSKKDWIQKTITKIQVSNSIPIPNKECVEATKQRALSIIEPCLKKYSVIMNSPYRKLRISQAKTRWGSCNSKKTIAINWRCALLPGDLMRYIIIHELSHIHHMNHSRDFWTYVERYDPYYKQHRNELKKFSRYLHLS